MFYLKYLIERMRMYSLMRKINIRYIEMNLSELLFKRKLIQ
jgi:hypothetical protein